MPRRARNRGSRRRQGSDRTRDYVIIRSASYRKEFRGARIYYEGKKPKALKKDGQIALGKHVMEALKAKFGEQKYRWVITPRTTSISTEYRIIRVRMAYAVLTSMQQQSIARGKDIKNDIVAHALPRLYPGHFDKRSAAPYISGTFATLLQSKVLSRLSPEDRAALISFIPTFVASEALPAVSMINAQAQIKSLRELEKQLAEALTEDRSESWWQGFIKANILIMQQGYMRAIEKLNTALGVTKYPDFILVTHDGYADVLEIKKPDTPLLKHDKSRDNYYWDGEASRAIIQVENYLEQLTKADERLSRHIEENYAGLKIKAIRPRGIILAGDTTKFSTTKQKDDFRRLSAATKNITFLTYDELHSRLLHYIGILEEKAKPFKKGIAQSTLTARK